MIIITDPKQLNFKDKTYILKINQEECRVLLESLREFDALPAKNKPNTKSLSLAIKEIDMALKKNEEIIEASIMKNPNENCVGDVCEV